MSRRRCAHTQNLFGSHRMHGIHRIIFRQKNIFLSRRRRRHTQFYLTEEHKNKFISHAKAQRTRSYMFLCLKLNGTHSKRRDVIPWRLPLTQTPQTHADYFGSHGTHRMHRLFKTEEQKDRFISHAKAQRARSYMFFCSSV